MAGAGGGGGRPARPGLDPYGRLGGGGLGPQAPGNPHEGQHQDKGQEPAMAKPGNPHPLLRRSFTVKDQGEIPFQAEGINLVATYPPVGEG